jgi:hypothetical protein
VRPARGRLSRTLSRARWDEYRRLLRAAQAHGYRIQALEDWVRQGSDDGERELILRHDVDQHPRSALVMAAIEAEVGARSTWYFRWRTAHPEVVRRLRAQGFGVGLHYETLTRRALRGENGGDSAIATARGELRREIAAFQERFGPIRSVCPHGDSRAPHVSNAELMRGCDPSEFGIEFDGNEAMRGRGLAFWLTDRSSPQGGWKDGVDPHALLADGVSPLLCLTHPNNWASGPSLWADRLLAAALPAPAPETGSRLIRTGRDEPSL